MVIEAIRQVAPEDRDVASIHIEIARITKAIVVPDDATGIELVLQLVHNSEVEDSTTQRQEECWQFTVMSCADGVSLEQNSSGCVKVRYNRQGRWPYSKNNREAAAMANYPRGLCRHHRAVPKVY
jgi:hypothetical protein